MPAKGLLARLYARTVIHCFVGKFGHSMEGVDTFQLLQGRPHYLAQDSLNLSHFTHWNEKGALQRANYSDDDITEVNWKEFTSLSGKLHRHPASRICEIECR